MHLSLVLHSLTCFSDFGTNTTCCNPSHIPIYLISADARFIGALEQNRALPPRCGTPMCYRCGSSRTRAHNTDNLGLAWPDGLSDDGGWALVSG